MAVIILSSFLIIILVLRETYCWRTTPHQVLAGLGASAFKWHECFLSKLVVSSSFPVAEVSMGLLEGRGKAKLGRWRKFWPGRWCQSKPEDCIQVEQALCFCGGCQVLVACREFGSCVVDAAVCWLYLPDGQTGFLVKKSTVL